MAYLHVILAAVAGFAVGAVWYMALGSRWAAALGTTPEEIRQRQGSLPFVIAFAANLLTAGILRHALAAAGVTGIGAGLVAGLGLGLFAVAPWVATNYAFAGRPRPLWWIDGGHVVFACAAIGTVLGGTL